MRRNQKFRKGNKNINPNKKKKRKDKVEIINKKALFNRYKNKQRVEEELVKKNRLEEKLKQAQVTYTDSEEEENPFQQLMSIFSKKQQHVEINSDCEDDNSDSISVKSMAVDDIAHNMHNENNKLDSIDYTHKYDSECENIADMEFDQETENEDLLENLNEPFLKHLQFDLDDNLLVALSSDSPNVEHITKSWPILGNLMVYIPKPLQNLPKKQINKIVIFDEQPCAKPGMIPAIINKVDYNQLYIKSQIHGNIVSANKTNLVKRDLEIVEIFTSLQKELFSIINNYQDLYYPERTFSNADEIRFIYCLHVVNHMLKTRTKILHHNSKLSKKMNVLEEFRDQGLVRPKVLIIVPFKNAAYKVVKTLIEILVPKESGQVVNKNRFEEDFTGGELIMPKKNPKPEDYELLFAGNTDDTFRLGLTLTKKTLKLYTNFYSSDIIIASPLGLRIIVGAEGEEDRDYDFLASIEILIMDQADVFLMQNWDHLLHVLEHFHLQPKKIHNTDFSRVRSWAVNGWTKYYRQTLIFSSMFLPEINAVFNKKCQNYAGKVRVHNPIEIGSIQQVILQYPHIFHKFNASDPISSLESRFEFFTKEVLPKHRDTLMSHTLIFVPSYFDYVKIRNYFKKEDIGFVQICEYSKDAKIARARDMFFHTEAHFLLYSERVHFFRRFRIKGIRHIIFYQPPTYPHFYSEMCNFMQEAFQNKYGGSEFNMTITTLYCKYDLHQISAILGTERTAKMMKSEKSVHMYMTGD